MQIGNLELDALYEVAIVPAIKACGMEVKRVDKHNEGKLLNSEIARFINEGDIIVADLTNERPNCYLEVGYTMGLGKFSNLILTAREDHFNDSLNYNPKGPRIHFDLGGYEILRWKMDALDTFRSELVKNIKRRQAVIHRQRIEQDANNQEIDNPWNEQWLFKHRLASSSALTTAGLTGAMQVAFAIQPPAATQNPPVMAT